MNTLHDLDPDDLVVAAAVSDAGPQPDRVEDPLHPRVGTVVDGVVDLSKLPNGSVLECALNGIPYLVTASDDGWTDTQDGHRVAWEGDLDGATILYVPLEPMLESYLRLEMAYASSGSDEWLDVMDKVWLQLSDADRALLDARNLQALGVP